MSENILMAELEKLLSNIRFEANLEVYFKIIEWAEIPNIPDYDFDEMD